jgi:hypothetical protein
MKVKDYTEHELNRMSNKQLKGVVKSAKKEYLRPLDQASIEIFSVILSRVK